MSNPYREATPGMRKTVIYELTADEVRDAIYFWVTQKRQRMSHGDRIELEVKAIDRDAIAAKTRAATIIITEIDE